MKKIIGISLIILMTLSSAATAQTQVKARKLSFAHVFALDHPVHVALLEANEMLKKRTNGRLELQIYPNGTFANYNDAVLAVTMGQLDMAPLDSASNYLPKAGIVLGPYVFRSYEHWKNFKASQTYENLKSEISKAVNVQQLDLYNFGFRNMTGNKIFKTLKDFETVKLRVVNFAPYNEIATIFNARGTSLPIGDVYMGLQSGVVDAQENPLTQIVTMKFYEVQKYLMLTRHMLAVSGTIMSKNAWNSLSKEDQAIITEVFKFEANRIDELVVKNEDALIQFVKSKGMQVLEMDTAPFKARVQLVLDKNPEWKAIYKEIQDIDG
jgi:tripartite ATP-independent transporter DctP family solute receptor